MRIGDSKPLQLIGHVLMTGGLFLTAWQSPVFGQEAIIGLQCAASCSEKNDGVSIARVSWKSDAMQPERVSLDWTVYKNGFNIEAYASFSPLQAQPEPRPVFAKSEIREARPFQIRLRSTERSTNDRWISGATLENLEPGVNYHFRLQFERDGRRVISETVMCTASVCIRDEEK